LEREEGAEAVIEDDSEVVLEDDSEAKDGGSGECEGEDADVEEGLEGDEVGDVILLHDLRNMSI
jgi:hypothetical protein